MQDKVVSLVLSKTPVLTHYSDSLTIGDTWGQPSIRSLCKSQGNDYAGVCISAILTEFLSFVKNSIKSDDVPLYADKILSSLPYWSMSDLVLCLRNGMNGKYGINEFPWQWSPDFVKWVQRYEEEKDNFSKQIHEDKKQAGVKADQELISMLPKELLEKFSREKFVDQEKRNRLDIKIPKEVVDKGLDAVDDWIERNINSKK